MIGRALIKLLAGTLLSLTIYSPLCAQSPQPLPQVQYSVSLKSARDHLVSVRILLPPGPAERTLQLPVWYALYQIRDFSQYVASVRLTSGSLTSIHKINKSEWQIENAENGAVVEYDVFVDNSGPFGAQFNSDHAFFNLAEILMYAVDCRSSAAEIRFTNIPSGWRVGTSLPTLVNGFKASSYDELVDSPIEISDFKETDFDQEGGHYRVIVDAQPGDYDIEKIAGMLRRIVSAEVSWMKDRPFSTYVFIYHFPREWGGGGMEHAYSTAIDVNTATLSSDPHSLEGVTAHEFFHLWNVKRIRPRSLEPPDYTKENSTDALWFSEGVTSTVEEYILLRSGLLDERQYLAHLAAAIEELENRPAHITQSAEESSIDAWLEKYAYYRGPQRSISYYNKGELLGVLLDLKMRDLSHGSMSLRDLFQWLNVNYAAKRQLFDDTEGLRRAAETLTHSDLHSFFENYIAGVEEIPWNKFLDSVGLQLVNDIVKFPDVGFEASRNFDAPLTVISIVPNSAAEKAGLSNGDAILEINGEPPGKDMTTILKALRPGDYIRLRVRRRNDEREVRWKVETRQQVEFRIKDQEHVTAQQRSRRAAWLKGESEMARPTPP